jgi:putative RecB family exonuclease
MAAFTSCALAFRFSAIDRLPEPPSIHATKGTLVHRALELLLRAEPDDRTPEVAVGLLHEAHREMADDPDLAGLDLDGEQSAALLADAENLVRRYFALEDPRRVRPVDLELQLEVELGGLLLRGIIDRLEVDEQGEWVVTDYKTGSVPREQYERRRLGGVQFYAYLCEQALGRRPARIQLLYLKEPVAIVAQPSDQSLRGLHQRALAVWEAVERACERDDFRPKPGPLCDWCAFQAYCPAFGGDPAEADALRLAATT